MQPSEITSSPRIQETSEQDASRVSPGQRDPSASLLHAGTGQSVPKALPLQTVLGKCSGHLAERTAVCGNKKVPDFVGPGSAETGQVQGHS